MSLKLNSGMTWSIAFPAAGGSAAAARQANTPNPIRTRIQAFDRIIDSPFALCLLKEIRRSIAIFARAGGEIKAFKAPASPPRAFYRILRPLHIKPAHAFATTRPTERVAARTP